MKMIEILNHLSITTTVNWLILYAVMLWNDKTSISLREISYWIIVHTMKYILLTCTVRKRSYLIIVYTMTYMFTYRMILMNVETLSLPCCNHDLWPMTCGSLMSGSQKCQTAWKRSTLKCISRKIFSTSRFCSSAHM